MAAANPILTPDRGKAHSVALGVLCVLAVVQVGAMARAVWLAKSRQAPAAMAKPAGQQVSAPGAPLVPSGALASRLMPPPAVPGAPPVSARVSPPITASPPVPQKIATTPELQELIDLAQQLRPLGDLKGALDVLRRADTLSPDHPAVLVEMARTFDDLGLKDKAAAAWRKAAAMGAPDAYQTAASHPRDTAGAIPASGSAVPPATGLITPESDVGDPSKVLAIGTCELLRDRAVMRGEKVTLRLPIRSRPGVVIDPNGIDIDVFFFDLVNGEKVEQTKADVPVNIWVDAPVDWKDRQERLDVVYSMPEMTADLIRSVGQRKFHGYIVKLYYQHKLQDTILEPESLRNFGAGASPTPAGNPLLPPVAR